MLHRRLKDILMVLIPLLLLALVLWPWVLFLSTYE